MPVVDTTGAGDACAAALAAGLASDRPFAESVQLAHEAAAIATMELGAYPSLLRLDVLLQGRAPLRGRS